MVTVFVPLVFCGETVSLLVKKYRNYNKKPGSALAHVILLGSCATLTLPLITTTLIINFIIRVVVIKGKVKVAHKPRRITCAKAEPGFCSMKQLRVLGSPLDGMLVQFAGLPPAVHVCRQYPFIHLGGERQCGVKFRASSLVANLAI